MLLLVSILLLGGASAYPNRSPMNNLRLLGGNDAERGQFPYVAGLSTRGSDPAGVDIFCGGSIVAKNWILTASFCVDWLHPNNLKVLVGLHRISRAEEAQTCYAAEFKKLTKPDSFDRDGIPKNDIALIKLKTTIIFNDFVKAIKLPETDSDQPTLVTIAGWGSVEFNLYPDNLQFIEVMTITKKECNQTLPDGWYISDSNICTTTKNHKCIGGIDSGDPVVAGGVQVGVVASGEDPATECDIYHPNYHTRVYSYVKKINEIIHT